MADVEYIKSLFAFHPDWPKSGVNFCDIFPVLRDPIAFEALITHFLSHVFTQVIPKVPVAADGSKKIDAVVGLDARGFLLGPILALRLGAAFVPVRKSGKLPGKVEAAVYAKEYGQDVFEMQSGAIKAGQRVLVVDDLIATGGSAKAAGELVKKNGGITAEYLFVVAIPFLKGAEALDAPVYAMVDID